MASNELGNVYAGQRLRPCAWEAIWARMFLCRLALALADFDQRGVQHLDHLDAAALRRVGKAAAVLLTEFDDPYVTGRQRDVHAARASGLEWRPLCHDYARTLAERERDG
jgi:hypothetical protein